MPTIHDSHERIRGCGWRKGGGTYLVSGGLMQACGLLPIPLDVCPTCHQGIKPARGWTWVDGQKLVEASAGCPGLPQYSCGTCGLRASFEGQLHRVGLLWIGEAFYKMPADFLRESAEQGVSRRISAVPRDFKLGETVVFLAHRNAVRLGRHFTDDGKPCGLVQVCEDERCFKGFLYGPGVFQVFRPQRLEYVVKGDEGDEKLAELEARGFTLIRVIREGESKDLPFEAEEEAAQ